MLQPGTWISGKYRVERLLGEGGMGSVYVATHDVLQKRVALKVLSAHIARHPEAVERFFREAMSASKVRHPAIVEIYDGGTHEGAPWMAMELLEGESLAARLERGPLSLDEVGPIFVPVLSALGALHESGIVHRDLKPDNIFLERLPDGRSAPKILDFGIAKTLGPISKLTETGAVLGTAHYLAPEQARDSSAVDHRSDLYAMGVVLYESLSGRRHFDADTLPELIAKLITEDPVPLRSVAPHVPPALAALVHECLSREPWRRPASAESLCSRLIDALSSRASAPLEVPRPPPSEGARAAPISASTWLKVVLGLALLSMLGMGCLVAVPFVLVAASVGSTTVSLGAMRQWSSTHTPRFADVSGDGQEDVVGWVTMILSRLEAHQMLCAYDGRDGAELWCEEGWPQRVGVRDPISVRAGDRLVAIRGDGHVAGLRLRDGETLWRANVLAHVDDVCAIGDTLAVRTRDQSWFTIDLMSGAAQLVRAAPLDCRTLRTDAVQRDSSFPVHPGDGYEVVGWGGRSRTRRERGMQIALTTPEGALLWAGLSRGEARNHGVLALRRDGVDAWIATVPTDTLRAQVQPPEALAVDRERVFVSYEMTGMGDAPRHASAFRTSDGTRLWDVPLAGAHGNSALFVTAGYDAVAIGAGTQVWILERETGVLRFVLGTPPPHRR